MTDRQRLLEESYEAHADALFRYCYFKLSDKERAHDVVQDAFVKVSNHLEKHDDILNIKALLYTTARNLIIDAYRKKKNVSLEHISERGGEFFSDEQSHIETHAELENTYRLLKKLSPTHAEILHLRYSDGLSIQEIARLLAISENSVSVRIHRALEELHIYLE